MIYLDYSATTPVSHEVMEAMNKVNKDFFANANSINALGLKSKNLLDSAVKQIAEVFGIKESEITFTQSSTECNNMALIGTMLANQKNGKHLIVSKLEHPSIYAICDYLKTIGFEVSYVEHKENGLVDFDSLKSLIRSDTVLVSICAVNSELGIRQPLKTIRQIIKKENENILFHSDMTQAIGKIPVSFKDVDLSSVSSHKIYGPKGIALLYKKDNVKMTPLIYGSGKSNLLKPGTPPLPLIVGFSKAIRLCTSDLEKRIKYITLLNNMIVNKLECYDDVLINKTEHCIPQILNVSLLNIRPETFIHAMDKEEIYLSTNTACSSGKESTSVMNIFQDEKRAMHTIRISLSHLTTIEEVKTFLEKFDIIYQNLNGLVG